MKKTETAYAFIRHTAADDDAQQERRARRARKRKRLLIVENDVDTRDALEIGLSDTYDVVSVGDAAAALSLLSDGRFDGMVIDLTTPAMAGEFLLRELRARDLHLPTIIASANLVLFKAMRESGAECVMRPLSLRMLEEKLSTLMEERFEGDRLTDPDGRTIAE